MLKLRTRLWSYGRNIYNKKTHDFFAFLDTGLDLWYIPLSFIKTDLIDLVLSKDL